jgi:hypothetical protein
MRRWRAVQLVVVAIAAICAPLAAADQSNKAKAAPVVTNVGCASASVQGTLIVLAADAEGRPLPNATTTLLDPATGVVHSSARTDADGKSTHALEGLDAAELALVSGLAGYVSDTRVLLLSDGCKRQVTVVLHDAFMGGCGVEGGPVGTAAPLTEQPGT